MRDMVDGAGAGPAWHRSTHALLPPDKQDEPCTALQIQHKLRQDETMTTLPQSLFVFCQRTCLAFLFFIMNSCTGSLGIHCHHKRQEPGLVSMSKGSTRAILQSQCETLPSFCQVAGCQSCNAMSRKVTGIWPPSPFGFPSCHAALWAGPDAFLGSSIVH